MFSLAVVFFVCFFLSHLSQKGQGESYCDHWMVAVHCQQLLQRTSPKLLAEF